MLNLVTGGNGQVGFHIIKALLKKGEKVRAFDISDSNLQEFKGKIEFVKGDMTNPETMKGISKGVDKIYHTAAIIDPSRSKEFLYNIHVNGTKNLLNEVLKNDPKVKHIINFGSASVYECKGKPADEKCCTSFNNPYEESKYAQEQAGWEFYKKHKLPITTVRLAMVYGPWGKHPKIDLIKLVALCKQFKLPFIPMIKGGKSMVHGVHVEDVAGAVIYLSERKDTIGELYNIADKTPMPVGELAGYIAEIMDYKRPIKSFPKPIAVFFGKIYETTCKWSHKKPEFKASDVCYLCTDYYFDNSKLLKTGYKLKWPNFKEGIKAVLDYYIKNNLVKF